MSIDNKDLQTKEKYSFNNWFKNCFGIRKWLIQDYTIIAFFCALTLVLAYIEEFFLPHLPFGGGFGLKYLPLFLITFMTDFLSGFLTGFISSLMMILFIPAQNIINPISFIFDYFLPMITPAIVAFLPFKKEKRTSYLLYSFIHCFTVFSFIYFWQVISGYFIWTTLFRDNVWAGWNPLLYSLTYNFIQVFLFTYPILQILMILVYPKLDAYKKAKVISK